MRLRQAIEESKEAAAYSSRSGDWISDFLVELGERGFVIAPATPTAAMLERGQGCLDCVPINRCVQQARQVWAGMIAVAAERSR